MLLLFRKYLENGIRTLKIYKMSTSKKSENDKDKVSIIEAWSDNLLVAALFIFLVLLGFIVR